VRRSAVDLLGEIAALSSSVSESIRGVTVKSRDQYEAARRSAGRIE